MNDGLDPIKHVYGEETSGSAPAPGSLQSVELQVLQEMKLVLSNMPQPTPPDATVIAIKDAAAADVFQALRSAYEEEGSVDSMGMDNARVAEYELLRTTKAALDRLHRSRPDPALIDSVKLAAAAHQVTPLLAAYGEGEAPQAQSPEYVEFSLLTTTMAALDTLPRVSAGSEGLEAVKSAAAEWQRAAVLAAYGEAAPPAPESANYVEYALLSSTRAALDTLPRARPDASVFAAVLGAATPDAPTLKMASDRPAQSRSNIRRWVPALAMAASIVIVAITGLWVANVLPVGQQAADTGLVAEAQPPVANDAAVFEAPPETETELAEAPPTGLFGQPPGSGQPTVSQHRLPSNVAASVPSAFGLPERRSVESNQTPGLTADVVSENRAERSEASRGIASADTNQPAATVSEWDAGEDVRVLSLRLNQLASSNEGLAWDEPPNPLGASEPMTGASADGIHAVRAGAPLGRVNVQMRSSERTNDQ